MKVLIWIYMAIAVTVVIVGIAMGENWYPLALALYLMFGALWLKKEDE